MTQKQFAERMNMTASQISRYLNGTREPKPETIANMATCLGVTSDYILGLSDDKLDNLSNGQVCAIIARNAENLSSQDKRNIIDSLLGKD